MSSWSKRRRTLYTTVATFFLVGAIIVPAFLIFYKAPTCSDGIKNGNEQGIDCGGSCQKLCQSAFLPPQLAWTRFEEIAPKYYNVAAYIVNPNKEGEAKNVPYNFAIYDNMGVLIIETAGTVTLPPHRNTIAFKSAVSVGERIPSKAVFAFTQAPIWYKKLDNLSPIVVGEKMYTEDSSGSSLVVPLKNTSVNSLYNVAVYVVLYDKEGNAIGFSKTIVDEIPPRDSAIAPFTWPIDRKNRVISIDVLPVQE